MNPLNKHTWGEQWNISNVIIHKVTETVGRHSNNNNNSNQLFTLVHIPVQPMNYKQKKLSTVKIYNTELSLINQ